MAEDTTEENHQFEQVLSRLDALMKRSHAPADESGPDLVDAVAVNGVPVLTEIYRGIELLPVAVVEQAAPPLLTEFVSVSPLVIEEPATEAALSAPELPVQPQLSREQEVDAAVAELMPKLHAIIARVAQEEFFYAQQNLLLRIGQEAEQELRLLLLQKVKPK